LIAFDRVSKRYESAEPVLRDFSLEVPEGSLCVLLGRSGAGKSTALRLVNRLIEPSTGRVTLDGKNVRERDAYELRRSIGYVLQRVGLLPHLSVGENVGLVPSLLGWPEARTRERVDELLELVSLDPATFRGRSPAQLSGGQQQRVGFARALAAYPRVLLMDEPFGALDPVTRTDLREEMLALQRRLGVTAMLVTHDVIEALVLADEIVVMDRGAIVQRGTARTIVENPANDFVARLIGSPSRDIARISSLKPGRSA
jgi:osmoprotectant transport system ATP-binding protein